MIGSRYGNETECSDLIGSFTMLATVPAWKIKATKITAWIQFFPLNQLTTHIGILYC